MSGSASTQPRTGRRNVQGKRVIGLQGEAREEGGTPFFSNKYTEGRKQMEYPKMLQGESLTRLLQGTALGVAITVAVGFNFTLGYGFGWTTGGKAQQRETTAPGQGRMSILAPVCEKDFAAKEGAVEKYKSTQSYNHDTVVRESLKMVLNNEMDYVLARACVIEIDANLSKSAEKKS